MRGSIKGPEPEVLAAWLVENNNGEGVSWGGFHVKAAVADELFKEQFGLCVYCGRSLKRGYDNMGRPVSHIEHFRPQAKYEQLRFAYGNLFLSCGESYVDGEQPSSWICGKAKHDWFDEAFHVYPDQVGCSSTFVHRPDGFVAMRGENPSAAAMIAVLNLNDPQLRAIRSALCTGIEQEIATAYAAGEGDYILDDLIQVWSGVDAEGRMKSFSHVACEYLAGL
jgi:conserved hypothetical protein TIGR02646